MNRDRQTAKNILPTLTNNKPSSYALEYGDPRVPSRLDVLESRLYHQEKTSDTLLSRAYKIKEDIIDSLNYTHGTWQEEKHARELLQEHIKTITAVVKKLNKDIESLESGIKQKENAAEGTSTAVKNLEVHHVAGLTDLRGRVVRCDASIARLSTDLKTCQDTVRSSTGQFQSEQQKFQEKINYLERRLQEISSHFDKSAAEQTIMVKHVEGDTSQQLSILDNKTKSMFEDVRGSVNTMKVIEESEREKLEARLMGWLDRNSAAREARLEKIERKLEDRLVSVEKRLQKMEDDQQRDRERSAIMQQMIEQKLSQMLDTTMHRHGDEIQKVKRECREGFSTVHESISNLKTVLEGKRKLTEEQMRKEIGQIRKMVVLI
ncbi:unnamed protein product [Owenia fusiformis]|uniref:Protein FAM81A n=1 Tax=Owenia fusiformis TaxID=6347 RepID=A0A8S4PRG4_OWEFU|nr:unnamed protein product [Owenia fusiformis]